MKHCVSVKQLSDPVLLDKLFKRADELQAMPLKDYPKPLEHMTLATLFYEPSTRTRLSFETAIQNLGGQLISTENAGQFSSAAKGETLEDTIRVVNCFAEGIVIRHPESGAAERAAAVSSVPIINSGDGTGEHPTQALLDVYSIFRAKKSLDGLKIALVGDLLNGRTVHSTAQLLAAFNVELVLIAPESLKMPQAYLDELDKQSIKYTEVDNWQDALGEVDVLYMTRVQKERFKLIEDYKAIKDNFILTLDQVRKMKEDAIVLHPLPRVNEIAVEVDSDPRAQYFQQVKNGLFVRMALLEEIYSS